MTNKHTDALDRIIEQVPNHGMTHARKLMEDYNLIKAALSPVDVEKIKQEMLEMLVMACDMHRPSEDYKQGWIDAINHISQLGVLR
jgi:ribosomal protein S7